MTITKANAVYAKDHPLSKDANFFQNGPTNDGWTLPGCGNLYLPPPGERN